MSLFFKESNNFHEKCIFGYLFVIIEIQARIRVIWYCVIALRGNVRFKLRLVGDFTQRWRWLKREKALIPALLMLCRCCRLGYNQRPT